MDDLCRGVGSEGGEFLCLRVLCVLNCMLTIIQIEWKGTGEGCTQTYIQAALTVPY